MRISDWSSDVCSSDLMAFSDACMASGVQPIIGTMLGVCRPDMPEGVEAPLDWLALYAQDKTGYDNLCALVARKSVVLGKRVSVSVGLGCRRHLKKKNNRDNKNN